MWLAQSYYCVHRGRSVGRTRGAGCTRHCVFAGVALRQREWDRADSDKQKQVKRASNKVRFDGGVNLLFHFDVFLGS